MDNNYLSIGKVAKKLGLKPRTIRFYEEAGLIPPPERRPGGWASAGYRMFSKKDIERLIFIKQVRHLDLSLNQIKGLLDAVEEGCCSLARPHLRVLLESKLPEIDEKIEVLKALRRNLKSLQQGSLEAEHNSRKASTCGPTSTVSECALVEPPIHMGQRNKRIVKNFKKKA